MKRKLYRAELTKLQLRLVRFQNYVIAKGLRVLIIFEGRDTAGKGGTIKQFLVPLNPRLAQVVALAKPTEREQGQWYFQRYICHLPSAGEIVAFDRSWYNRAGVEPVMGFCTEAQHQAFLDAVTRLDQALVFVERTGTGALLAGAGRRCHQALENLAHRPGGP